MPNLKPDTLSKIVSLPGCKNNRLYILRAGKEILLKLIGGDDALDTLTDIVAATNGNWRDYITLETHAEFGEFAYVNGGAAEGDTLFE